MGARKLILAWTFSKDEGEWDNNPVLHKEMKVQDSNGDSLCAVIMGDMTEKEQILKILTFMAVETGKFKGTHLILLHETYRGYGATTIQELIGSDEIDACLKDCRYNFFGGGKGIIYERLLEDVSIFREEAFYEQNVIKKDVFNVIWNEYVKKKITKLKFDYLSMYLPIVIGMRGLRECAEGKGDAENYLLEIKKEGRALFSEDSLNKDDWAEGLSDKIKAAVEKIAFLGAIIEEATVPQDVINEMKKKKFNIDNWYSELSECFKL